MAAIDDVDDPQAYSVSCPTCSSFIELCPRSRSMDPYNHTGSYTGSLAALNPDPNVVDWHDYYWGYTLSSRHKRRTILRPLPLRITDRVPQELFENIIDGLVSDARDLYNCALVCHAWYPRSTMRLYERVYVHPYGYDGLARFALRNPRARVYLERTRVLAMCECAVWNLKPHKQGDADEEARSTPHNWHFTPTLPLVLGRALPHLQCLSFDRGLRPPYHSSFFTCIAAWREVRHLELSGCRLSVADFRRIVLALPNLRHLHIPNISLVSTGARVHAGTAVAACVAAPRLRSLAVMVLDRGATQAILEWLAASRVCCQMEVLDLWDKPMPWVPDLWTSIAALVRAAGKSLKALLLAGSYRAAITGACPLRFSAAGSLMHQRFAPPLTLDHSQLIAYAPCLVYLRLPVACQNSKMPSRGLADIFETLLTEIASAQLRTLEVTVDFVQFGDIPINSSACIADLSESMDVGALHALAKASKYDMLRSVHIQFVIPYGWVTDSVLMSPQTLEDPVIAMLCARMRLLLWPWHIRGVLVPPSLADFISITM